MMLIEKFCFIEVKLLQRQQYANSEIGAIINFILSIEEIFLYKENKMKRNKMISPPRNNMETNIRLIHFLSIISYHLSY